MAKKIKVEKVEEKKTDKKEKKDKKKLAETPEAKDDKPTRGLDIGGNFGWTGKLPSTLLHEHCQKNKWGKVQFDMKKVPQGFIGIVKLSWENPKTKEWVNLTWLPDKETLAPCQTTNEARHFAATYALHRINYMKNMKMLFPIIFRDYWVKLDQERLVLLKSNKNAHDLKFSANPFLSHLQQEKSKLDKAKERQLKLDNDAKTKKLVVSIGTINKVNKVEKIASVNSFTKPITDKPIATFPKKVWDNAPFIDFSSEIRISLEKSIRNHINWILHELVDSSTIDYKPRLLKLGFRQPHIEESCKYTNSFVDSLEWLLFHIPEDDLPPFFAKSDKDSAVSLKISKNIQVEYLLSRLSQSGFDHDDIILALEKCNQIEVDTAVYLTNQLLDSVSSEPYPDSQELWNEEFEAIEMIGSNSAEYFEGSNNKIINIQLNPSNIKSNLLSLRLFKSENYPNQLPGIHLIVNDQSFKLANYIKLSIIKQLVGYLQNGHLGGCFIFTMIEWLEENIAKIIENPGPLLEDNIIKKLNNQDSSLTLKQNGKSQRFIKLSQQDMLELKNTYNNKLNSKELLQQISKRQNLPAWQKRQELVTVINSNKVTLVTGETGSGKSTQIVQFILDELNAKGNFESKIMCTQPRRISTIGLAERITEERVDKVGNETGYIIRGENRTTAKTRISFVTTGVLLRMLQSIISSNKKDSLFNTLEYIFVDEVHERSVDSDFLLIILKNIMNKYPKLKIILMSATINVETFKNFFHVPLNHIHIEGRTFPIKDYYLDSILTDLDYTITNGDGELIKPKSDSHFFKSGTMNYNLIAKLCKFIDTKLESENNNGSILVFLPGIMEINQCIREIGNVLGGDGWILPLHSALLSADQKRVFRTPARGVRKIVVSTNVAETSITIPDCVAVIDSGRSKSMFYDNKINATKLIEAWCSKAEIGQRRGRSGRVTKGNCYHLYTEETVSEMLSQPIPEIKRTRLENLYLIVKALGISNVEEFLEGGLDAPEKTSMSKSKKFLQDIGALNNEHLSNLGKYLSLLPTDLQSGKLLILGCIFGCLEKCLTLAAISSTGSPFLNSYEQRDKIKQVQNQFANDQGDLVSMTNVMDEFENLKRNKQNTNKFISKNYLSYLTVNDISSTKSQYVSLLQEIGFVPLGYKRSSPDFQTLNRNNDNFAVIRAIITGSLYPQIARVQLPDPKYFKSASGSIAIDPDAKQTKFWIRDEEYVDLIDKEESVEGKLPANRAFIHPSSVLFSNNTGSGSMDSSNYVNEDGTIDMSKAREEFDLTPKATSNTNAALKSSFVVYKSSHHTTKLYLRDITPTSTLATLLFGGEIYYNLSQNIANGSTSPGIVLDNWMPIKTWCKNGVLIKRLRKLLDGLLDAKLSNPTQAANTSNDDVLTIIERILVL